jgi:hypothetical protein
MKRLIVTLLIACLPAAASAETLGQATQEVRDRAEALIGQRLPEADSWGEQTAIEDLRLVHQNAAALLEALSGTDAMAVRTFQQELSSSGRRLKASAPLLPAAPADAATVEELETRIAAIDARLTELRLRFDQKATLTPGPLAGENLSADDPTFEIYSNPQTLLIDVRDARRLVSSLEVAHFPGYGFGFGQPNNLDSVQVRRMILAAWDLERSLESQFGDISEVLDEWVTFRREYDRMGYPGSNQVVRQLERVMDRLTLFFDGVATP